MTTRNDLTAAYQACRRANGTDATLAIVAKFGDDLDSISESRWPQLIAALKAATNNDDRWMKGHTTFSTAAIWSRFNGDWKAKRGRA